MQTTTFSHAKWYVTEKNETYMILTGLVYGYTYGYAFLCKKERTYRQATNTSSFPSIQPTSRTCAWSKDDKHHLKHKSLIAHKLTVEIGGKRQKKTIVQKSWNLCIRFRFPKKVWRRNKITRLGYSLFSILWWIGEPTFVHAECFLDVQQAPS